MHRLKKIDYLSGMKIFSEAEQIGSRMRLGDFTTSQWLQQNNINLDQVIELARQLQDAKITIIGTGLDQGFYIYSQKQKTCYKFDHQFAEV